MSEKRFDIDDSDMVIDDLLTGESYIFDSEGDCDACYDLLNELNDENKSFKAEIEQLKKCYNNALDEMDTLAEVNDKIYKENKELKKLNSNIQKSIDYQDETIKEQCNKLDWASECGVRWEDEYNKWIGNLRTEKRFDIDTIDGGESVLADDGKELSLNETCNLLNELNNKNEELQFYLELNETNNNYVIKQLKEEIKQLAEENKELTKRLSYAEKVNMGLIDENHRLRLTLIHSSDLNFDINWLKENLKDWDNE